MQYGLSCATETWLLDAYLHSQLNQTKVRKQDAINGLRYAFLHPASHMHAMSFVRANWHLIEENFTGRLRW